MFEPGDEIRVTGEMGRFKVIRIRENGDIDCWGGLGGSEGIRKTTGHAQWRTFRADRCRKVKQKRKG